MTCSLPYALRCASTAIYGVMDGNWVASNFTLLLIHCARPLAELAGPVEPLQVNHWMAVPQNGQGLASEAISWILTSWNCTNLLPWVCSMSGRLLPPWAAMCAGASWMGLKVRPAHNLACLLPA